ncbi:peptidoglycan bridge formation glycyltransferase FemA/FemB family protein [Candidatus Peregrinibacteria bacterium]|nr:peptidoglycan bridge formation glycyltransferase FemA/FemB family protein [Candidatus Peregrinibacteria bacterium]MBI3816484.1 peptidoglycan bridge formation glycyltransferase FemA/FemB family protein [Candidatus Peregrinibacteria bacterium]
MAIRILTEPHDLALYDAWVRNHPHGNLWQSLEWREFQEHLERWTRLYVLEEQAQIRSSALVVIDETALGFQTWNMPRGPLWRVDSRQWNVESMLTGLIDRIVEDAKKDRSLCLFLSPAVPLSTVHCTLSTSCRHEQPEATRIIDLRPPEEEILAQMHPKGRYNIRVAQRHGVEIRESKDSDSWHRLMTQTMERDGFRAPPKGRHRAFLDHLEKSFLLLAYEKSTTEPIAGLMGVVWNGVGIYYYGASSRAHRSLMAPYLLQWEAMRRSKAQRCVSYDLLGIAPPGSPQTHPWATLSDFKAKFGGTILEYPPEQELSLRPIVHRLLRWKRKILG